MVPMAPWHPEKKKEETFYLAPTSPNRIISESSSSSNDKDAALARILEQTRISPDGNSHGQQGPSNGREASAKGRERSAMVETEPEYPPSEW